MSKVVNTATRQDEGSSIASFDIVAAPCVEDRRPQSANGFQSTKRKLLLAANGQNTHLSMAIQSSTPQRRPQSSRYPRRPSATSPRSRPHFVAMQLWRHSEAPVATRHHFVVQKVIREEIDEQRRVTLDAQRQLHDLQVTIRRRQEELELAQRHVRAFGSSLAAMSATKRGTRVALLDESAVQTAKAQPKAMDFGLNLKQEIGRQDAYKKRLQHKHDQLLQHVRYLEAKNELHAKRRQTLHRERALCHNRINIESDKKRHLEQQLCQLLDKRAAFRRSALPVLESYRDEIASRLMINKRRHDADRRRNDLLQFIANEDSKVSLSRATAKVPATQGKRRNPYNVLMADVEETKRETLFSVYEEQYTRVLEETDEADLNVVLNRYQSYRESAARLREVEAELRAKGVELTREQEACHAMVSRLRTSGPAGVIEHRERVRDRLEGQLHAQEFEKNQAREQINAQLKAFVYVQQGILHIVELLQCLEDGPERTLAFSGTLLANARKVMGGPQAAETALTSVAPALKSLVDVARDVARRGLQREWFKLPALGYSVPQIMRLEQFAPQGQLQCDLFRTSDDDDGQEVCILECTHSDQCISEHDEEFGTDKRNVIVTRKTIKRQSKETLRQAEAILRQVNEARRSSQTRRGKPCLLQLRADTEIVATHFREQRRVAKQERRHMSGNVPSPDPQSTTSNCTNLNVMPGAPSPRRNLR